MTAMPARNRLPMALPLEQFFPALHQRIITIPNLEPCCLLRFSDVASEGVLGDDTLQVLFADTLKQRSAISLDVVGVPQRKRRKAKHQPQFVAEDGGEIPCLQRYAK
jgi:hypothetical protein